MHYNIVCDETNRTVFIIRWFNRNRCESNVPGVAKPRLVSRMRLFELSVKLYFYFYVLQSVEILLSGTVISDGFTHRRWPRAPRFWGLPFLWRLIINLKFAKLWRRITSQYTLKRATMQTSSLDYQYQGCGVGSLVIRLRLLAISIIRLQLRLRTHSDLQLY